LNQTHAYPTSVGQLVPFGLNREVASGVSDGYVFTVVPHAGFPPFLARATPAVPGKTGVDTCTIDNTLLIQCSPTPGADTAQHVMFLRLGAIGGSEMAKLILGPGAAAATAEHVKNYLAQPSTVVDVFNGLDVNHEGIVTPAKILSFATVDASPAGTSPPPTIFSDLLTAVKGEMALGAGNEHISSLPGVRLSDLPQR
jgi:hypothetical protein